MKGSLGKLSLLALFLALISLIPFLPSGHEKVAAVHTQAGDKYLAQAYEKTHVPNIVSAVLADYRGVDTMLETGVVFIAGIGVLMILGTPLSNLALARNPYSAEKLKRPPHAIPSAPLSPIIQMTSDIMTPVLYLFGLYVLVHGHYSPGGGFQAGVILGGTFILQSMAYNLHEGLKRFPLKSILVCAASGLLTYVLTGFLSIIAGGKFLDYGALSNLFPCTPETAHYWGIFVVEIGVTATVTAVIYLIYVQLASFGRRLSGL